MSCSLNSSKEDIKEVTSGVGFRGSNSIKEVIQGMFQGVLHMGIVQKPMFRNFNKHGDA